MSAGRFVGLDAGRDMMEASVRPTGEVWRMDTCDDSLTRMAENIARILALPDVKEKFDGAFLDPMPQGSVEMARFLDEEVRQWKAVAVQTGISLE